ncbi:unnamed protein product [Camellia sinensis]
MVETILFNLASKILGKISSGAIGEVCKAWGIEQELNTLEGTLSTIKAMLLDADRLAMGLWFDRLQAALYDAGNLLDELHFQGLRRQVNAGHEAFQSGRHTEAVEHYTATVSSNIKSRPFAAICFCNRAAAHQSLGQIADAIADCSLAIVLDGSYSKAVSRRATLHETIRDYEQAASDLHRLISLLEKHSQEKVQQCGSQDGSAGGNVKELRQARCRVSSVEEKVGIKPSNAASEIKKAYRKAALRHHPDKAGQFLARNGDDGQLWKEIADEVHKDADRLFKMIGEAYAVLSDPTKRSHYDLPEELRNAQKESNGSRASRGPSDYYSSPFDGNASR